MVHAHKEICPIRNRRLQIDLPADFPKGGTAEVIVLALEHPDPAVENQCPDEWLTSVWGRAPDFPDRLPDLPSAPVETL